MYIKNIVLDGFKSYGRRTVVENFDPEFNAITGLNGSGKSNILDAICFVLGITQLSHVRVNALQDLVYKSGQSGVVKATVSITFDNLDKSSSPVGFEKFNEITVTRQVVIGGKNKYLINGVNVQNKRIQDFFCSIQLNVNNPHFLIMQGRITKVLNMKPPEILSMVEEAAGTKMYELKKQAAQKLIEKKEAKLREINDLANEEIIPKLNKLREERKIYLEFQAVERELENLTNMLIAFEYISSKRQMQHTLNELEHKNQMMEEMQTKIVNNKKQIEEIDADVIEFQNKNSKNNDQVSNLESELKENEKTLAQNSAQEKSAKSAVASEEKRLKQLIKSMNDDETALNSKEKEMSGANDMFQKLKSTEESDVAAYEAAEKKFEAINAGMEIGDDGEAATLQEQLMKAKQDAAEAATTVKQSMMQLQYNEGQLKDKQKEIGASAADYKSDKASLENLERDLKNFTKQLQGLKYDENQSDVLQTQRRQFMDECRGLSQTVERFEAQHPQVDFQYQDPEPNFNRRSVKGLVCKLITVKDKSAALALETAAGSQLFNVITDTELTGKKLLQHGQLRQRVTLIPLNKIKGRVIPPNTVKYAQSLVGAENVQSALSLIEYNKELQPAMEFIFGNVFICKDMNVAKRVAFDKQILKRCVTLEGDVCDPGGTLTGGAMKQGGSFLLLLDQYKGQQAQLLAKQQDLNRLETEVKNLQIAEDKYRQIKQKYDIASHEHGIVKKRLQQTSHYQQQEEIENLKKTIVELQESIKVNKEAEKVNLAKAKKIENEINNSKNTKEQKLKEAENEMKRLKKQAENSKKLWKEKEQYYETLKLEIIELKKSITNGQEQINSAEKTIEELKEKLSEANRVVVEAKEIVSTLETTLKQEKQKVAMKNKEVQSKLNQKSKLLTQISDTELEIKKINISIEQLNERCKDFNAKEAQLEKRIRKDDTRLKDAELMSDQDGHDLKKRVARTQDTKNKLSRNVNIKAQRLFEQEEKQYTNLMKKKRTVETDKVKLLKVIEEMDQQKMSFLRTASEQISKDFGSIFSTLLPGTNAKLQPPEGKTYVDGLEFKVSIGGIWKENLNELSGGQKSLIALSLILAMLLFKPAPIYILDEVDSALDLSHTQNIGKMLKKHFKQSQFIIVSLKDGMFSNANVLFRTKFVNGLSTIGRIQNDNNY